MKLSVIVLAYNHEKFIRQALDSVLQQQLDCDFEILIGEDCSTDDTRSIVKQYRDRAPDRIQLFLPIENLGFFGNKIFAALLRMARGEYLAMLDGDDYWTAVDKLQKQVRFLDSHPRCAMCFHNVLQVQEDGGYGHWGYTPPDKKEISHLED